MSLKVGDKAPDFTLVNTDTKEVSLADYKGKNVVLLFFPLAFTGVCTTELCEMRDNIATYSNLDAEIVAVSVDSPFTLAKFKEEQKLPFPLLSDFNKTTSEAYGSIYHDFVLGMKGVSKRSAFLIDKEGVVQHAEVLDDAGKIPDFTAVQSALSAL
ncbi:MAG: redoxin domain-containing protein [Spirosomaceae bacterium]|nr:redoxin domain-containing protein [Spirosomataceae bacterium]